MSMVVRERSCSKNRSSFAQARSLLVAFDYIVILRTAITDKKLKGLVSGNWAIKKKKGNNSDLRMGDFLSV